MTTNNKASPGRRNSIAVAGQHRARPGHRRRAHSIAPGDPLSPASKARRSLAPRKSILKAAFSAPEDGDDRTQAMDMTGVVRFDVENTRKSLGRRVSFANHAHVRLFEVPEHNTNSTGSPQSSPAAEADSYRGTNDENAYPGAAGFRRHSAIRRSVAFSDGGGEESMDMDTDDTGYSPAAFFRTGNDVENMEGLDDFADEDGSLDDEDMDVTEAIPHNILRKRSLSLGAPRQPLANLTVPQASFDNQGEDEDEPPDQSFVEGDSAQSLTSDGNTSQPMEFTVPLVRPPQPPSEAWLALRAATHSGNTPYIPSSEDEDEGGGARDMEIADALSRLEAHRATVALSSPDGKDGQPDSFTSTEDSFAEENSRDSDEANQTVNVTQLMRRVSLAPSTGDSTMEVTSVYDAEEQRHASPAPAPPSSSTAITTVTNPSELQPQQPAPVSTAKLTSPIPPDAPSESPPPEEPPSGATTSTPFTFTPRPRTPVSPGLMRPSSPSKAGPSSPGKFTAAFAPPVARPSPGKRSTSLAGIPDGRASPAKKVAGPAKLTVGFAHPDKTQPPKSPGRTSPSKSRPLEVQQSSQPVAGPSKPAPLGLRRPSGYLAQRRSLGGATLAPPVSDMSRSGRTSPGITGAGRKSIAVSSDADGTAPHFDLAAEKARIEKDGASRDPTEVVDSVDPVEVEHMKATSPHDPPEAPTIALQPPDIPSRGDSPRPSPSLTPVPEPLHHTIETTRSEQHVADDLDSTPADDASTIATEQWREDVQQADSGEEDGPQISIEQFFEMTGIRFMDEIAAPRRSTVHASALRPSRRASTEAQIPLAEYVIAMAVDVPQLELYTHVSKDLQAWIERIQGIFQEAEEEALKMTPQLFQEFVTTDETGQAELIHQLKLIKVHNHEQAKSEWYDWKMQWVEQLYQKASQGFQKLEGDAKFLESVIHKAQDILPGLQQEYDQLMEELEREKADVAELEACDQDYLNELKGSIAEQSAELDTYRRDVEETKGKLNRLQEKLNEVEAQKNDAASAIEGTERLIHVQKNSTRAEVFRLKDELEAIQNLHMLAITKVQVDLFEFVYASCYHVSIPCARYQPLAGNIQITRLPDVKTKYKEAFPALSSLVLQTAKDLVNRHAVLGIRQIVEYLGDYWCCCSQLQAQLKLVAIKYPVSIKENPDGFSANVTVLFPKVKAKAIVSFIFDAANFSSWPARIRSTQCDVQVAYGSVERRIILDAVVARMKDANPVNNHACLLDACMEASECFA